MSARTSRLDLSETADAPGNVLEVRVDRPGEHSPSDGELVESARQGDGRAFDELLQRHEARVLRVVRLLGVPAEDREDVAQEVFVRVFRGLDRFRTGRPFGAWVYRISVNACHDYRRHRRRRPEWSASDTLLSDSPDRGPGPAEQMARVERRARLEQALEELSERERAVFVLCEMESLETRAVARALGISSITVRRHLGRARRRLRLIFRDESG